MNAMNLFVPITKVDVARREVWGRLVQEVPDKSGEIFDYESSKPYFKAWSDEFSKATDGKSLGNLRAMHGKVAAGKFIQMDFNDDAKAVDVGSKVVDDNEWEKVLEGVYTGYSIGGSYVGEKVAEKIDGKDVKRYTAKPVEGSLVDSPCIPTAKFFDIIKADGTTLQKAFKETAPATPENTGAAVGGAAAPVAVAKTTESAGAEQTSTIGAAPAASTTADNIELEVTGSDAEVAEFAKALNESKLTMADAIKAVQVAAAERAVAGMIETVEDLDKREFSTDERKAAAKEGAALPDGSFPIKSVGDLDNAIKAYGRAKDKAAAKAHIIKRAKALGASDKIPDAWRDKSDKAAGGELRKNLYDIGEFASCLCSLASLARSAEYEAQNEDDNSAVPMKLRNAVDDLLAVFKEMADEEATELLASLKSSAGVGDDDEIEEAIEAAAHVGDLRKRLADPELSFPDLYAIAVKELGDDGVKALKAAQVGDLAKAVIEKASSKVDAARVQEIHDHAVGMGADCSTSKAAPVEDLSKAATPELAKVVSELAAANERIAKLEAQPMPSRVMMLTKSVSKAQENAADGAAPTDEQLAKQFVVRSANGEIDAAASAIKIQQHFGGKPSAFAAS